MPEQIVGVVMIVQAMKRPFCVDPWPVELVSGPPDLRRRWPRMVTTLLMIPSLNEFLVSRKLPGPPTLKAAGPG